VRVRVRVRACECARAFARENRGVWVHVCERESGKEGSRESARVCGRAHAHSRERSAECGFMCVRERETESCYTCICEREVRSVDSFVCSL